VGQNETRRHFEARNLDADMRKAAEEAGRITPHEHVRRLRTENVFMLVLLAVIVGVVCFIFGVF
jgi:predicted nucleic acid-binding Zn ribbon protein